MRLDKFICKSTDLTRDQAQQAIAQHEIKVNGQVITAAGFQVHENNHIERLVCDQQWQVLIARPSRYIMLHKLAQSQCSHSDHPYPSIWQQLSDIDRADDLHLAGRLDADTTGLVLLTDDGRWSFDIIRPEAKCEKIYRVTLRDNPEHDYAKRLAAGLKLQGEEKPTLPARFEIPDPRQPRQVLLTICEGRYHQVKRMFAALGNRVQQLHRQQIGELALDIAPGQWRYLTNEEVTALAKPTPVATSGQHQSTDPQQ